MVNRLCRHTSKYWAVFLAQLENTLAYPADLFIRSLSIMMFMWIFVQLWRTTYTATGAETIAGLSLNSTLWYLLFAEVMILSKPRISRAVSDGVKDGTIASLLNKPYDFLLYQLSLGLGDSLVRLGVNTLMGGVVVWLSVGPPPAPASLPLVGVAVVFALLVDFCINAMVGMLAFLTEEITAFEWILQKFLLVLGGVLIPLDFFPGWLRSIALALPFASTIYTPARLFVDPSLPLFFQLVSLQIAWLVGLAFVLWIFYQRSLRWLSVNGG